MIAANVKRLTADLRQLKSASVNLRVNASGIAAAQRQLAQLRQQAVSPNRRVIRGGGRGGRGPLGFCRSRRHQSHIRCGGLRDVLPDPVLEEAAGWSHQTC